MKPSRRKYYKQFTDTRKTESSKYKNIKESCYKKKGKEKVRIHPFFLVDFAFFPLGIKFCWCFLIDKLMDFFLLKLSLRFGRLDLVTHMLDFAEGLAREERRKWDVKGRRKKGLENFG